MKVWYRVVGSQSCDGYMSLKTTPTIKESTKNKKWTRRGLNKDSRRPRECGREIMRVEISQVHKPMKLSEVTYVVRELEAGTDAQRQQTKNM